MTSLKGKIIAASAVVAALLAGYVIVVYWFVVPQITDGKGTRDIDSKTIVGKDLNPSKVRVRVKDGNITSERKMLLTLILSGLDEAAIIELQKDDNLLIEINEIAAKILSRESFEGDALLVQTESDVSDQQYKDFNNGKFQILDLRTDLNYNQGDTISKMLTTRFKKGSKKSSLGQEIAFNDKDVLEPLDNPVAGIASEPQKELNNLQKKAETQISRPVEKTKRIIEDKYYSNDNYDSVKEKIQPSTKIDEDNYPVKTTNDKTKSVMKKVKEKID